MKKTLFLFLTVVLFVSCTNNLLLVEENASQDYLACDQLLDISKLSLYPFTPFTESEMQTLSYEDKLAWRQVPEDFLREMTTEALFYQFVYCELSRTMYAHNSLQTGFKAIAKQLNMLPELLNRPDAVNVLLKKLQQIAISQISGSDCFHCYESLQRIMAQPEIINHMSTADVKQYVSLQMNFQEAVRKQAAVDKDQWSYPESLTTILFGLGNVMLCYEFLPFKQLLEANQGVSAFMADGNMYGDSNQEFVLLMNDYIARFIKSQK